MTNTDGNFRIVQPTRGTHNGITPGGAPGRELFQRSVQTAKNRARETADAIAALSDLARSAPIYRVTEPLATAINTALCVQAPLLLTGEPGTGKTQVAYYLAWYLGIELHRYQARSTSTANDLKYDFDAVAYLHYAQADKSVAPDPKQVRRRFLKPRALWQAYEETEPCVLLIDEIDKAPRDFPNDLLHELDEHEFEHPFNPEEKISPKADRPPIVVATSNAERRLPDAFLRRCIVHHLHIDDTFMREIVAERSGGYPDLDKAVIEAALDRFERLRKVPTLTRKPSIAELLTWLAVLSARGTSADDLRGELRELPGIETLIKDARDLDELKTRR